MTIVCAGLLGGTANGLNGKIAASKKLDARKQILSAVIKIDGKTPQEINTLFTSEIKGYVVNSKGDIITTEKNKKGVDIPLVAEEVNPRNEYKKSSLSEKNFPVFEYIKNGKIEAYVLPIYGNGLWDEVWGYIAVNTDLKTVKGIGFGHKAETPGLGARITEKAVQDRFKDKVIYNTDGKVVLEFLKGEGNLNVQEYEVDGLSGATMTSKGVNSMLSNYLGYYKPYFAKASSNVSLSTTATTSNTVALADNSTKSDTPEYAGVSSVVDQTLDVKK